MKNWFSSCCILMLIRTCCGCQDTGTVVLEGGSSPMEGRVELCQDGEWGTICDSDWDAADARVVCRQLGFSDNDARAVDNDDFIRGTGTIHGGDYHCTGNEERLIHCPREENDCGQNDNAAVRCQPASCETGSLRVADGGSNFSGRVEICIQQQWGTICDDNWGVAESAVVCRQLGLSSEGSIPISFGSFGDASIDAIHMSNVQCEGQEESLLSCTYSSQHTCSHREDAGVICHGQCSNGDVRIVDMQGMAASRGRVEVCLDQKWNSVCDNSWSEEDAKVVCQQLGYSLSVALAPTDLGSPLPIGAISFRNINCTGDETKLVHCQTINQEETQFDKNGCTPVGVGCGSEAATDEIQTPGPTNMPPNSSNSSTTHITVVSSESYLPWAIAGTCGAMLLILVLTNLMCIVVLFAKKQKLPELREDTSTSNPPYDSIQRDNITTYEDNPTYGESPCLERPFNLVSNSSYKQNTSNARLESLEYTNVSSIYTEDGYVNCEV